MSTDAKQEAQWRCPDTCHKVEEAINNAVFDVLIRSDWFTEAADIQVVTDIVTTAAFAAAKKHGTERLREALIAAEDERLDVQKERDTLKDELSDARRERDDAQEERDSLQDDNRQLNREMESLRDELEQTQEALAEANTQ